MSIQSVLQIYEDLKLEEIQFIYTRRLNQDSIENFFGKVRPVVTARNQRVKKLEWPLKRCL